MDVPAFVSRRLFKIFYKFLDILCPYQCLSCGEMVEGTGVCFSCWKGCAFIDGNICRVCGLPLILDVPLCGGCDLAPFHQFLDVHRSTYRYHSAIKAMILSLKHGKNLSLIPFMGQMMATRRKDFIRQWDMLVPVPLHWRRFFTRGFNQSLLLAKEVSRLTGVPCVHQGLLRTVWTPAQFGSKDQRRKNVDGSFSISPKTPHIFKKARVLLVDDVYTTGSTLEACSKTLKRKGGCDQVGALTFAQVSYLV